MIERLDELGAAELAALAFCVLQVDAAGQVLSCNRADARLLDIATAPAVGRNLFGDLAPCTRLPGFYGRFLEGVRRGALDERFRFVFGSDPRPVLVEVTMRAARRQPDRYWVVLHPLEVLEASDHRVAGQADATVGRRVRAEPVDPRVCEREAIHIPGGVQPHIVMLALDPADPGLVVQACSDNVGDAFDDEQATAIIGRSFEALVPPDFLQALHTVLAGPGFDDPAQSWRRAVRLGRKSVPFAAAVHRHADRLIVELERVAEHPEDFGAATPLQAQDAVARLRAADTLADAGMVAAREIRAMTGFERVLLYRFDGDWNGEAVGEDLSPAWPSSLMGLRFPASDIPAQARALYARSTSRFVADRDAVPAALVGVAQAANAPVDLTFAQARALSPVHLEYQRNLGVNGSMSVSIMVGGVLWGLVIGHHRRPHYLTPETRALAALVTDAFALRVHELETAQLWRGQQTTLAVQNRLLEQLARSDDFVAALTGEGQGTTLLDLFPVGGAAIVGSDRLVTIGIAPPPEVLLEIAAWLRTALPPQERVFETCRLADHHPAGTAWREIASGLLAAFVSQDHGARADLLLWFRPEIASTVTWGGDPNKPVFADASTQTVLPRRSFERWVEERRGYAEPWAPWQVATAGTLTAATGGVILRQTRLIRELTAQQEALTYALEQKDVLAREIDHRVKNSLQIVAGVMLMQARGVADPVARAAFEDTYARVMSIARVHDSLHQSDSMESVDLGQTLRRLCEDLAAGMTGAAQRLDVSAEPGLMVSSQTAVALSLIATELVTNALKYAYPAGEPGHVGVKVSAGPDGGVEMQVSDQGRGLPQDWSDRSGAGGRGAGGLGMRVIRAMLQQVGAEMEVGDAARGASFTIRA